MKEVFLFSAILLCGFVFTDSARGQLAMSNKYRLSSTPFDVVTPVFPMDPDSATRVVGQIYYNLATLEFRGIDSTGSPVTLGSAIGSQAPDVTTLESAGTGTYTTPSGAKYLRVRLVGGGGGGGYGAGASSYSASGGGAGGYIDAIIYNPAASYDYQVGNFGNGGAAGTAGDPGARGGTGSIIIEAFFQ